jgi:hypothetical protein
MKINDILNEGIVRSYHMDDFKRRLEIPEEIIELYGVTGDEQRGRPESAMVKAQVALGGGVLSFCIEHCGDLSNRASPMHGFGWGMEAAADKAERVLNTLKYGYGFAKEHEENNIANAKHREIPVEEFKATVDQVLMTYADEHRKLKVWNRVQELGRDASVALGEKRFDDAASMLEEFLAIADDEEKYTETLKFYYKTPR